jgi:hypothetical protein
MNTMQQTHGTRLRRGRRLAITLALSVSAALATIGGAGRALAFEPNNEATPYPPGATEHGLAVNPGALDFLPGASVIGPEF